MKPGDIHWIEFTAGGGHEQTGRRPAIVLQDDAYTGISPLLIVVPLTGATSAIRFPGTLLLVPDASNNLRKPSVALVFQIRAVDRLAIAERIGKITNRQLAETYALLDRLTGRQTA